MLYLARAKHRIPDSELWHSSASKFLGGDVYVLCAGLWFIRIGFRVPCVLSEPAGFYCTTNRRVAVPGGAMYHYNDALYW